MVCIDARSFKVTCLQVLVPKDARSYELACLHIYVYIYIYMYKNACPTRME